MIPLKLREVNFQDLSLVWAPSRTLCLIWYCNFVFLFPQKSPSNFLRFRLCKARLLGVGLGLGLSLRQGHAGADNSPFSTIWWVLHSLVEILSELSLLTSLHDSSKKRVISDKFLCDKLPPRSFSQHSGQVNLRGLMHA